MPVLDNTQQDDVLVFDGSTSFDGGMDSRTLPRALPADKYVEMVNIDTAENGTASTRKGTELWGTGLTANSTKPVQGMGFYNTYDKTELIVARDGKIYAQQSESPTAAWVRVNLQFGNFDLSSSDATVYFTMLEGKMFFSDGVGTLRWIEPLSTTASGLVIRTAPQQDFSTPQVPAILPAPSGLLFLTTHLGRIFAVDKQYPDTLRVSTILSASGTQSWNSVDSTTLSGLRAISDGDAITGVTTWTGTKLVIFKRHSTFVLDAAGDVSDWSIQNIDENVGCASHGTIARVGSDVFWLSDEGVRTLVRTLSGTENQVSDPLSRPINSLIGDIYQPSIEKSSAYFYENRYILSVPKVPDASTRFSIVFNTLTRSWSGKWVGMDALHYIRYTNGTVDSLFLGMQDGTVRRWFGGGKADSFASFMYYDVGVPYESYVVTRDYTFGDYLTKKSLFSAEIDFLESSADIDMSLIRDSSAKVGIITDADTDTIGVTLPFFLNSECILSTAYEKRIGCSFIGTEQCKAVRLYIHSAAGRMNLVSVAISAYIDTYLPTINQ